MEDYHMEFPFASVKTALREVLEDMLDIDEYEIGDRWVGGKMVLVPYDESLQSKEVPIESFFKKITGVREKLRVLEQKVNNHNALSAEDKVEFQKLITRAYGSMTTFNVLFKRDEDKFSGMSG
jgi:hypothetical protein